ncbi:MAG: S1 RNA-binding domain-containing protein [Candidatus Diapherotrites archaeon]|jgi:translation initiation factor 2 subunit 1|uniref:S1 RNA-binding domain-containing protein n=1 Tax=Candidatus Iainarchaeum sp. TaxID=3101447 RepID=A0A8T5GDS9_9ARCH|nr:S1 RNA-binding domain-containing protein [Candidatus Diapherotrites archaeon]
MEYPDRNELVVVKVTQILDYGVFAELLEYDNAKGFIHISNVSSSWVKNIRNVVKSNQVRVAKVLNIDTEKRQIDLSFARVSPQREKQKLAEFKQVNREENLIQILAKQEKKKFDDVWDEVADPLIEEYGSLFDAFEKILFGEDVEKIIGKNWVKPVKQLVEKNVVISKKVLKGNLKLSSLSQDGLEDVKEVLSVIDKSKCCSLIYFGAGSYAISSEGQTFKDAEKSLNGIILEAEKVAKKKQVSFEFKQEEK